jgi:CHAT domain-containing protein
MSEKTGENETVRGYLLGTIDPAEREKLEERFMVDDALFNKIMLDEEDLIQEYADGELAPGDRRAFEDHFLITRDRNDKLKFARALRKYVDEQPTPPEFPGFRERFFKSLKNSFRSPRFAGALVLIIVGLFAGWYFVLRSTANDRATVALNRAFENARPLEARITDFDYAPYPTTRGENEKEVDTDALLLATTYILAQEGNPPSAGSLHATGRLYLAKRDFDEAIKHFQDAGKIDPNNAEVSNDLGVAYLEKNKLSPDPVLLPDALNLFDKAIALDPRLLSAYFNRAICLQSMKLPNQAREAWQKYVELDPSSKWANEAREHLDSLNLSSHQDISADDAEKAFIAAFNAGDDQLAFQLSSQNRELIRQKYLPQKLAMSLVDAPSQRERDQKLAALKYLGTLEQERINDNFAGDLARYYGSLSDRKLDLLKKAQIAVREGYGLCLDDKYAAAKQQFEIARDTFIQADNRIEANTIAEYFIAYCTYALRNRVDASKKLETVGEFSDRKGYKWFALMNLYWSLGGRESLALTTVTEATEEYETALKQAREIGDAYMIQKFLVSLTLKSDFVRQERKTLSYVAELMNFSDQDNLSSRQKYRNFDQVIQVLVRSRFQAFANAVVKESIYLADSVNKTPLFAIGVDINVSTALMKTGLLEEAEQRLIEARGIALTLSEGVERDRELACVLLNLGHLERIRNNYQTARQYYDESMNLLEKINLEAPDRSKNGAILFEARKSRLLALKAIGDDLAIRQDIPATVKLSEEYRSEIVDEQARFSFFDDQQVVYDIAIDEALRAKRNEEAYEYAEVSNSRSISDWLAKGARIYADGLQPRILLEDSGPPVKLSQLRESIPERAQIVQFRVLDDRVAIWLISRDKFLVFSSAISSNDLKNKVETYVDLMRAHREADQARLNEISVELYRLLVAPVRQHLDAAKDTCLIPSKFLFYLPFSSLLSPEGKYLIEDLTISYAPGADVFVRCTKNAALKEGVQKEERIFSIGNPVFDHKQFPNLTDLRDADTEAKAIAKNYAGGSTVLTGNAATKDSFLAVYKDYDVIHFAGHYIVEPDSPLLSKLVMANVGANTDTLTNLDLIKEKLLKTKLVVLSACQTGVENYYGGEGLVGLSRTFLVAGAPLVVASAWKVDSPATNPLMQNFHRHRKQDGLTTVRALRAAQLDMLRETNGRYKDPYYWAAFSAFGGYANY